MTEPDLVQVLSGRFNVDTRLLNNLTGSEFPKKLFEILDKSLVHNLLMEIFNKSILAGIGLCEAEKAIIKEVRTWNPKDMPISLYQASYMFLDSDLADIRRRYY